MSSDQWRVKAAGSCLNRGLRRLHGLKLRDWIGRDVERDLYGKRAGEGTGFLSQSLSAPLIPYDLLCGRLKGVSRISSRISIAFVSQSGSGRLYRDWIRHREIHMTQDWLWDLLSPSLFTPLIPP